MSQVKKKWIGLNEVTGSQFRLDNAQSFRARNFAGLSDVALFRLNTSDQLDFIGNVLKGIGAPVAPTDAATKAYVDAQIGGVDLSNVLLRDGTVPMTGNLDLNGKKIINLLGPTGDGDAVNKYFLEQNFLRDNTAKVSGDAWSIDSDGTLHFQANYSPTNALDMGGGSLLANGGIVLANGFNAGGTILQNLGAPVSANDAATKTYVDAAISVSQEGLIVKDSVHAATVAALPSVTYNNGASGVGATLTATANGVIPTIDGATLALNSRLLVKNQVAALQNGIYKVTQVGTVGTPFILTRTTDFDNSPSSEVRAGARTWVATGTTNGGQAYVMNVEGTIIIGTTAITFTLYSDTSGIVAGLGLTKTGNVIDAGAGAGIDVLIDSIRIGTQGNGIQGGGGPTLSILAVKENLTLGAPDITNQYKDLANEVLASSVNLSVGGVVQYEGFDYTLSLVGSVTRVTFIGDLATGGAAQLLAGDILRVQYLKK